MKKVLLTLSIISGYFLTLNRASAAHIGGGDVTYRFISFNADSTIATYEFTMTMYRDAQTGGATFDVVTFGIFRKVNVTEWRFYNAVIRGIDDQKLIVLSSLPCLDNVSYEKASYIFRVELPVDQSDYLVAYQRCCRTPNLSNIYEPEETGMAFVVEITAESIRLGNSSPSFVKDPVFTGCTGRTLNDVCATMEDEEDDILVYSFCAPLAAGGTFDSSTGNLGCCECVRPNPSECLPPYDQVVFRNGYYASEPFGIGSDITLDSQTGELRGTVDFSGRYQYGICVEEYRDGMLMSKIYGDYQINFASCADVDSSELIIAYRDSDGDGFGDSDEMGTYCDLPSGFVLNGDDCDDENASINPDAMEINGNSIDEDCDGFLTSTKDDVLDAISLFPNPTSDILHIRGVNPDIEYILSDKGGRVMMKGQLTANGIDISELAEGIYFLRLRDSAMTEEIALRVVKI